jgi:hypothetical protein
MSAVLNRQENSIARPDRITSLRFVDATELCLLALEGFDGIEDYEGLLANPSDLSEVKSRLEKLFDADDPESTLYMVDGWFNKVACAGKGEGTFSQPAIEVFEFITTAGFHCCIFRGFSDEHEACSLAAREVVSSYLN